MREITKRKCALCRRAGYKLYLKNERCYLEKCALTRRKYAPGMHGSSSAPRRKSEFGRQLIGKQNIKRIYGLGEAQFAGYVKKAKNFIGNIDEKLFNLLELRLDNVVFRLGLATSRSHARQMISHGLIKVNDRKVTIPSYQVKKGDEISLRNKPEEDVVKLIKRNLRERSLPAWLSAVSKEGKAKVKILPKAADIDKNLDLTSVIEYYSLR